MTEMPWIQTEDDFSRVFPPEVWLMPNTVIVMDFGWHDNGMEVSFTDGEMHEAARQQLRMY